MQLVWTSQFLQQIKLDVRHKQKKEHNIPDTLSRLANTNVGSIDPGYSELDELFTYNATLVKIHPILVSRIVAGFEVNTYWSCLQR